MNSIERLPIIIIFHFDRLKFGQGLSGDGRGGVHRYGPLQRDVAVAESADLPAPQGAAGRPRGFARGYAPGGGGRRRELAVCYRQTELRVAQQRRRTTAQVGHHRSYHR